MRWLSLLAIVAASGAQAEARCEQRVEIVGKLQSVYGENFYGGGLQTPVSIIEVWRSEEKGTWTILLTRPDGVSCIMASGTHWRKALPRHRIVPPPD